MKPTKFELMRAGRVRAETLVFHVKTVIREEFEAMYEAPAVPTMEIDGVKYREVPENSCKGCDIATASGIDCFKANKAASKAFGRACSHGFIYIRAE